MEAKPSLEALKCAADPELINITHKHPALSYAHRKDLDPETLIAAHYPLSLANKIISFLEPEPKPEPKPERPASPGTKEPTRRLIIRLNYGAARSVSVGGTTTTAIDRRSISSSETLVPPDSRSASPQRSRAASIKDNFPFMTPARQLLSISNLKKGRSLSPEKLDTGRTARTMTPGGTQFSPLKTEQFSPLPIRRLHEIPAASFSPPKTRSTTKSKRRHRSPSIPFRQPVRHLLEYDPNPRQVDDYYPQPVLTLRHCLDTTALSDVFAWAKQCATAGKIIPLKECLINFRDWSRVHDLHEAAIVLGLKILQTQCELVLEEWETEFDDWQTYPVDRTASQDLQRRHQERSKNMVNGAFLKYASEQIVETMPLPEPPISEDVAMKDETDSDIPLASIVSEQATDAVRGGSRGGGRGGRGNRGGRGCGRGTGTGKRGRRGRTPKVT